MIVFFFLFLLPRIGVSKFCGVLLGVNIQYPKTTITHITEGVRVLLVISHGGWIV